MRSAGRPNNHAASITSSPLFIIVAESTLILRPMTQLGWAQAASGDIAANCSSGVSRNGPPEAVSSSSSTPAGASPQRKSLGRHWKIALCSLSIGSKVPPPAVMASISSAPDMTSDSLFANRIRRPLRAAARVGNKPAAPTMAAMTCSAAGCSATANRPASPGTTSVSIDSARKRAASVAAASGSDIAANSGRWRRQMASMPSISERADTATQRKWSGWRAMTSSVLAPILPVAPRIATPMLMRPASAARGPAPGLLQTGYPGGRECRRALATDARCLSPAPDA